jgi:hypothetical protein
MGNSAVGFLLLLRAGFMNGSLMLAMRFTRTRDSQIAVCTDFTPVTMLR